MVVNYAAARVVEHRQLAGILGLTQLSHSASIGIQTGPGSPKYGEFAMGRAQFPVDDADSGPIPSLSCFFPTNYGYPFSSTRGGCAVCHLAFAWHASL
jgi:hypothetical protein